MCLTDLANPQYMVSAQGFEPRTHALEGRCSIQLSYAPIFLMERVKGIEPSQPAWKAGTLPLSYTRIYILLIIFIFLYTFFGGGWWIRTTESNANRFTVCPLWPLGNPSSFVLTRINYIRKIFKCKRFFTLFFIFLKKLYNIDSFKQY